VVEGEKWRCFRERWVALLSLASTGELFFQASWGGREVFNLLTHITYLHYIKVLKNTFFDT
jgi:hypothetical protein